MIQKKKILFICIENSIHATKWINALAHNEEYEIYLFPVSINVPHEELSKQVRVLEHPLIKGMNHLYSKAKKSKYFLMRFLGPNFIGIIRKVLLRYDYVLDKSSTKISCFNRVDRLERVIKELQPDLVHALEFQHSAYLANSVRKRGSRNALSYKFAVSNWGSDIEFYKNNYRDVELISEITFNADLLFVECDRDAKYAKDSFGYQGPIFKVINSVGINFSAMPKLRELINNRDRKIILVKGYESKFGRASLAYQALEECSLELKKKGCKVLSYSTTEESKKIINEINMRGLLSIEVLPYLKNQDLLQIFTRSQIYIGIGVSDGISISAIEAMAAGAIPIQTNTSCCNEWYVDGVGGFIVSPSIESIKKSVLEIIEGNFDRDHAIKTNYNKVFDDANYSINAKKVQNYYSEIFN